MAMLNNILYFTAFVVQVYILIFQLVNAKVVHINDDVPTTPKIFYRSSDIAPSLLSKNAEDHMFFEEGKRNMSDIVAHYQLNRGKRDTLSDASASPKFYSTSLPDETHNEAIVHWSGKKSDVMFVLTRHRTQNGTVSSSVLWRSEDYGSSFNKVILPKGALFIVINYYYVCPVNHDKLVFTDVLNKMAYFTSDEGKTFARMPTPFTPDKLLFHPTLENWLLGYSLDEDKLYVTPDFGKSWDLVATSVHSRFFWFVPGIDNDTSTVHVELRNEYTGEYYYHQFTRPYDQTAPVMSFGPIEMDSLLVQNEYIFLQKSTSHSSELYVSWNRRQFLKAYFPKYSVPQDFTLVDSDEGRVFLAANHREGSVNLYLSDTTGQFYVSSLTNVLALRKEEGGFEADLVEVRGLRGVYIANQRQAGNVNPRTLITFDQGGKWTQISAPKLGFMNSVNDNKAPVTKCELPTCGLHLHLKLSSLLYGIPSLLAEQNAPGIILAQGVIGSELSLYESGLVISSDGGLTWKALFDGDFNHNVLDQGGAMVAVPERNGVSVGHLLWSCTEGSMWQNISFPAMRVEGVLTELGINSLIVSLFGHPSDRTSGWIVAKVDFTSVLINACGDNDYVNWTASDGVDGHQCLLGQKVTYKRRKADSVCFNGRNYTQSIATEPCPCTEEDFECDYGYDEVPDGSCVPSTWFNPSFPIADCEEGSSYWHSSGHRKIAGDDCVGGELDNKYKATPYPCPVMQPIGLHVVMATGLEVLAVGQKVNFTLTQEGGSKTSTKYSWNCGTDSTVVTKTGFDNGQRHECVFKRKGHYDIRVVASNKAGNTSFVAKIVVEDVIQSVSVTQTHAARVNEPVEFYVEVLPKNDTAGDLLSTVHYLWIFGDEESKAAQRPQMSWETSIQHTYTQVGSYSLLAQAVNSVSSRFSRKIVNVYASLVVLQLVFNSDTSNINRDTPYWRAMFAQTVHNYLAKELNLELNRFEVTVLRGRFPTVADVAILPEKQDVFTEEAKLLPIAEQLILKAKNQSMKLSGPELGFSEDENIVIVDGFLNQEHYADEQKSQRNLAIFIGVPMLFVILFVAALVIVYYKKRLVTPNNRRYRLLQSNSRGENDGLLEGNEEVDDDDVPPLNPNPEQRLSFGDDDPLDVNHSDLSTVSGRLTVHT